MTEQKHKVTLKRVNDTELTVAVDGRVLKLQHSLSVRNHSPTGFNAGYGGSGPAQTALAILLRVTGREIALRHYQDFKFRYLADPKYLQNGVHEFTFTLAEVLGGAA